MGIGPRAGPADQALQRPAFEGIATDRTGRVWVNVPDDDGGGRFDVFDAGGSQLAGARFRGGAPALDQVRVRAGHLYGVIRDDLDVPYVVRFRIEQ